VPPPLTGLRGPRASKLTLTPNSMATDLKNILREEAAQCRRLAELVTEQTIRQALMEMAARLEAIAHEDRNDEQ
jgi:hypothetical protein